MEHSEEEYKAIFSKNLKWYLFISGKKQTDIARDLGYPPGSISSWCGGDRLPRMDKVQALADYFGIKISDLLEDHSVEHEQDRLFKEKKILFSKVSNATADDMTKINQIIDMVIGSEKD